VKLKGGSQTETLKSGIFLENPSQIEKVAAKPQVVIPKCAKSDLLKCKSCPVGKYHNHVHENQT
jgi:hypothetical protein